MKSCEANSTSAGRQQPIHQVSYTWKAGRGHPAVVQIRAEGQQRKCAGHETDRLAHAPEGLVVRPPVPAAGHQPLQLPAATADRRGITRHPRGSVPWTLPAAECLTATGCRLNSQRFEKYMYHGQCGCGADCCNPGKLTGTASRGCVHRPACPTHPSAWRGRSMAQTSKCPAAG